MNLMDYPVEYLDVAVHVIYEARAIDVILARAVLGPEDGQLMVSQVGQGELAVLLCGEQGEGEALRDEVCPVDDAVLDDDGTDGIEFRAVGESAEGIPRGRGDEARVHQLLQIVADSLVGGGKARVVAASREKLVEGRLASAADRYRLQQVNVFRVVVGMLLQIADHRIPAEDIACRGVYALPTSREGKHQQHQKREKRDSLQPLAAILVPDGTRLMTFTKPD